VRAVDGRLPLRCLAPISAGDREAQLGALLLNEKMRVSRAAVVALVEFGDHTLGCSFSDGDEPCDCGFDRCLAEWRKASDGRST